MTEAYIIDAVRTAVGRRGGGFAASHPADMAAHVIRTVTGRNEFDQEAIDDVIFGCLDNIGAQAGDIARTAALGAGLPDSVPGVTIDRQCGSAQQAVHFAAQAVMSGTSDLIVAGGVQNMSQFPILCAFAAGEPYGSTDPWTGSQAWKARFGDQEISQFRGAEMMAEHWNLTREDNEKFAYESHRRALGAISKGYFTREITEFAGVSVDQGPRADTSLEKMAALKTLTEGGRLTAAVASQISDGASATLLASDWAVAEYGLKPRARIHHVSARGADPIYMLTAPIPATKWALEQTGLTIDDIDVVEINEAFASVVLAWLKETGANPDKVNVHGGAIALGHPLGATGAKLFATLLNELERVNGRYGLLTICEGGGTANVTIIERIS